MTKTTRQERGWAGHFICGKECWFRRNTLLSRGKKKMLVSTVGNYHAQRDGRLETIGAFGRYYETMAFLAHKDGSYWEADVGKHLSFDSNWSLCFDDEKKIPEDIDLKADAMHEAVVAEFMKKKEWK